MSTNTGEIIREESADTLVLAIAEGSEARLPRADLADSQPGTVSLMPPGFAQMLSPQELADLLAFLKETRR